MEDGAETIIEVDRSLFYGETLTIALPHDLDFGPLATLYMQNNPGVTIELMIDPNWFDEFSNIQTRLSAEIMAGSGPILIDSIFLSDLDPRTTPFFVDWLPIMNADPDFNEDEWFMNVFEAFSVDGRLYSFPTRFGFFTASVNSTIEGLYETFNEAFPIYSGVTTDQMMEFYRNFPTDSHYWFEPFFGFRWLTRNYLDYFMDLGSGWVDFDNERFIDLITNMRELIEPEEIASTHIDMGEAWSQRYFYSPHLAGNSLTILDWDPHPLSFFGTTPIINESGELLVRNMGGYILNANASPIQQALAWDFIMFTMNPENLQLDVFAMQPTNRNVVRHNAEQFLEPFLERILLSHGVQPVLSLDEAKEDLISRMNMFGDMPMRRMYNAPPAIAEIISTELQSFLDGHTTAEQAASDIQSRVELVMMEMGLR